MSDYALSFEDANDSRTMKGDTAGPTETAVGIPFGSSSTWLRSNGMLSRSISNEEQCSNSLLPPTSFKFHSLPNEYICYSPSKEGEPKTDSSMQNQLNPGSANNERPSEKVNDSYSSTDDKMTFQRARELFRTMESSLDKCTRYRQECLPSGNRCIKAVSNPERSTEAANVLSPPPSLLNNESRTSFGRNGFTSNNCLDSRDVQSEKGRSRPRFLTLRDENTLRGTVFDGGATNSANLFICPTVHLPSIKDANANNVNPCDSPSNRTSSHPPILPKPKPYPKRRFVPHPTGDQGPSTDHSTPIGQGFLSDCGPMEHGSLSDRSPVEHDVSTESRASVAHLLSNSLSNSQCSAVQINFLCTTDSVQNMLHSDRLLTNSQDLSRETSSKNHSGRPDARCERGLKREDSGHEDGVSWRRSQLEDIRSPRALGGVLLPKRRSREEGSFGVFSNESVEAALSEAAGEFKRMDETMEEMESRMLESTCSSGSGEEMAEAATLDRPLSELNPSPVDDDSPSSHRWSGSWTSVRGQGVKEKDGHLSADEAGHSVGDHEWNDDVTTNQSSVTCEQMETIRMIGHYDALPITDAAVAMENLLYANTGSAAMATQEYGTETETIATLNCVKETETAVMGVDLLVTHRTGEEDYEFERETTNCAMGNLENDIETESGDGLNPGEQQITDNEIGGYCYQYYDTCGLPISDEDDDCDEERNCDPTETKKGVRFSRQPIRVFLTYSADDYDRRNDEIDPMSASAEYELEKRLEQMDEYEVELKKGDGGLGLSIIGIGVGAEIGIEKLGIFIKTLSGGGVAEQDGRIRVGDQIIEVDRQTLVGVTQSYAASVLRRTSDTVHLLMGRERDNSSSEILRLIEQSIEQDKERHKERQDDVDDAHRLLPQQLTPDETSAADDGIENAESQDDSMSVADTLDTLDDLDSATPDMDSRLMFIRLKEIQYKHGLSEAELAKLKARMILLENSDSHRKASERKSEDMAQRLRVSDRILQNLQRDIARYKDALEEASARFTAMECRLLSDYSRMEKKYRKAKKLIKEFQQRERDCLSDRESTYQEEDKEHQCNDLIKSLKERIFILEKSLADTSMLSSWPPSSFPVMPSFYQEEEKGVATSPKTDLNHFHRSRPFQLLMEESSEDSSSPEFTPDEEPSDDVKCSILDYGNVTRSTDHPIPSPLQYPPTKLTPSQDTATSTDCSKSDDDRSENSLDDEPFFRHDSDGTVLRKRYKRSSSADDENDGQRQDLSSKVNECQETETSEKERVEEDTGSALTNQPRLSHHASLDHRSTEAQMDARDASCDDVAAAAAVTNDALRRSIYGLLRSRTEDGLLGGDGSSVAAAAEEEKKEALASRRMMTSAEVHRSSSADVIQALDMVLLRHEIFLQRSTLGPDVYGNRVSTVSTSGACVERRASSGLVEHVTTGFGCDGRRGVDGHCMTMAMVSGDAMVREPRNSEELKRGPFPVTELRSQKMDKTAVGCFANSAVEASAFVREAEVIELDGISRLSPTMTTIEGQTEDNGRLLPVSKRVTNDDDDDCQTTSTGSKQRRNEKQLQGTAKNISIGERSDITAQPQLSTDDSCVSSCWSSRGRRTRWSPIYNMDVSSSGPDQVTDVPSWAPHQVAEWLTKHNFIIYASNFLEKQVDGKRLLELDSTKMKSLGMKTSKERDSLKKKLKDLRAAIERQRKEEQRQHKTKDRLLTRQQDAPPPPPPPPSKTTTKRKILFFGK